MRGLLALHVIFVGAEEQVAGQVTDCIEQIERYAHLILSYFNPTQNGGESLAKSHCSISPETPNPVACSGRKASQ